MKKITIAVAVVAVATVGAIIAVAQMSHQVGINQHFASFVNPHEQMFDHISEKLKLTGEQKTQAKQIFADAKTRFKPLHDKLKETHKDSMNLGANGVFDEQKSQEVAARQAEIIKQLLVEKERTKAALFAVLTPEQREQAKHLMNDMVENFAH